MNRILQLKQLAESLGIWSEVEEEQVLTAQEVSYAEDSIYTTSCDSSGITGYSDYLDRHPYADRVVLGMDKLTERNLIMENVTKRPSFRLRNKISHIVRYYIHGAEGKTLFLTGVLGNDLQRALQIMLHPAGYHRLTNIAKYILSFNPSMSDGSIYDISSIKRALNDIKINGLTE